MITFNPLPKNTVISGYNKDDVCMSVIYHLKDHIAYKSKTLVNSVISSDDVKQEFYAKICHVVNYFYKKGLTDKTIKDVVNFAVRAIRNHEVNLKIHYASRPDTSINTDRIKEEVDKDDDESVGTISSVDDCSEEVIANDQGMKFLLYLLTNGFVDEYVILREVLFTSKPVMEGIRGDITVKTVCHYFFLTREETKLIEERIKILGVRFGFPVKKPFSHAYMLSNGIVS